MDQAILKTKLLTLLQEFVKENDIKSDSQIDEKTRLIGNSSIFDSMDLIQFIVEVESMLEEDYNLNIQLTSDKAMSRRTSPFISIDSLVNFINDENQ
jgi:acyl carrier protein